MKSKAEVRREIAAALAFSPAEHAGESARLCEVIAREPAWAQARTVALFAAHGSEPDLDGLRARAAGHVFAFPRMRENELDFFRVDDPAEFVEGRFGVREPRLDEARRIGFAEIDLILVPGIAFTRDGRRLGRGGGFYDRLLARPELRGAKLGVCFSPQILADLPSEPHDQCVDRVICELD